MISLHDVFQLAFAVFRLNALPYIQTRDFFDSLLSQIHVYGKDSNFFLYDDYNARYADYENFIAGIDDIPEKHITTCISMAKYCVNF